MRPPFPYFGGKMTIAPRIAAMLPEHTHYVEPHCGSLAVLFAKRPSDHETVNDKDHALMTFWRVLRTRGAELARACALTPHSRAEYGNAVALDATDELELARQLFIRLTQGRSGGLRRSSWRHYVDPAGSSVGMPGYIKGYVDRMAPAAERLSHVTLECREAAEIIAKYGAEDAAYRHEMRTDDQHRQLADQLRTAQAAVVLSGYPSDLYDLELYPDWDRVEMAASTGQGGTWANRTEVLWSNRPLVRHHQAGLFEAEAAS